MINLMIADDNVQLTEHLYYMLTKENDIRVVNLSHTGSEAFMAYKHFNPTVLLLDLNMPDLNGFELLEKLSDNKRNVIIISGSTDLKSKITDARKIEWIFSKPYDYNKLLKAIRNIELVKNEEDLNEKIEQILRILLFDSFSKGTTLLKTAISIAYANRNLQLDEIINKVARTHNITNPKTVHSTIDKCISATYKKHNDNKVFCKLFTDFYGDKPTTKNLIKYIINYFDNLDNTYESLKKIV